MGLGYMLNCCNVSLKQIYDADLTFKSLALNNSFFSFKFNELIWHRINAGVMMLCTEMLYIYCLLK